jgi:CrcB protein
VSFPVWIGIGLLGGLGAVARLGVELRVGHDLGVHIVNLTGAFLLGLLAGASGDTFAVLGTGFLGAYSTFSGWMRTRPRDIGVTLALGLVAVFLGDRLF